MRTKLLECIPVDNCSRNTKTGLSVTIPNGYLNIDNDHPLQRAQNLLTHPLPPLAYPRPFPIPFDQSLSLRYTVKTLLEHLIKGMSLCL